ncbi:hypothetical protein GQ651_11790 [Alphaproteobacteria bacterium GH1-50]|uniref:Secreted protein n=1 Tax=Kangsaoukella pontilimi TaxID=2691042 RepID=A0A7C9IGT1_9RHOB|nr:hypothetical protein [Kangsaoukella pontilimi]MXQ08528.1 hypothetical protein [Kangsaoukella pontilimi]
MRRFAILALALMPVIAQAQDGARPGDRTFQSEALAARLSGQVIEYFDGSKSRYAADRRYGYTYTDDGPVWAGTWRTEGESRVCVAFDNGSARCDRMVENAGRLVLIIADGTRFPVRTVSEITE